MPEQTTSKNNPPTSITVVIPVYNSAQFISELLLALKVQTYAPDEVICADDGSSDNTRDICREFGARVLELPHGGPAKARNQGAFASKSDITVFVDSDCIPTPEWLEQLTKPIRSGTADVAKGAYLTKQSSGAAIFAQLEFEGRYRRLESFKHIDFVDTYSMAILTDVFRSIGGFDGSFPRADNEDVDLSYRLNSQGYRMVFVPQAKVYHQHPSGWGEYLQIKIGRGYWRFKVYSRYPGKALKDSYTPQSLKLQMLALLLVLPGLIIGAVWNWWITLMSPALFVLFSTGFICQTMRKSVKLMGVVWIGLFLRSLGLLLGSLAGFWHFVILRADNK